ncbi:MAG: hypothetical protein IT436_15970 [Phycisphaerales bacterium]|nr:hypothetical protein [Phycisphaerales bacterium]
MEQPPPELRGYTPIVPGLLYERVEDGGAYGLLRLTRLTLPDDRSLMAELSAAARRVLYNPVELQRGCSRYERLVANLPAFALADLALPTPHGAALVLLHSARSLDLQRWLSVPCVRVDYQLLPGRDDRAAGLFPARDAAYSSRQRLRWDLPLAQPARGHTPVLNARKLSDRRWTTALGPYDWMAVGQLSQVVHDADVLSSEGKGLRDVSGEHMGYQLALTLEGIRQSIGAVRTT